MTIANRIEKPVWGLPAYPGDSLATEAESWLNYQVTDPMTAREWRCARDVRDEFVLRFGFAIITHDLCEWVGSHELFAPATTFIGVGSGTGYFEYELNRRGHSAIATDPARWEESYGCALIQPFSGIDVRRMDHRGALELMDAVPGSVMLLSWPSYDERWTEEVVRDYRGRYLIYIGEGNANVPGCTGSLGMLEALEIQYRHVGTFCGASFVRIADSLRIYERRDA